MEEFLCSIAPARFDCVNGRKRLFLFAVSFAAVR